MNYENFKEVYIANTFFKVWDILDEKTALEYFQLLLKIFPDMKAWITLEPINKIIKKGWTNMIILLIDTLEKRQLYFTPSGIYNRYSKTFIINHNYKEESLISTPNISYIGKYNIPTFILRKDWENCIYEFNNINNDILIKLYTNSVKQWNDLETKSFYYKEINDVLKIVVHYNNKSFGFDINDEIYSSKDYDKSLNIIWHSKYTKCSKCPKEFIKIEEYEYKKEIINSFFWCIPYKTYKLIKTPINHNYNNFQLIINEARKLRKRRLQGIFFCGMKLLGKYKYYKKFNLIKD